MKVVLLLLLLAASFLFGYSLVRHLARHLKPGVEGRHRTNEIPAPAWQLSLPPYTDGTSDRWEKPALDVHDPGWEEH